MKTITYTCCLCCTIRKPEDLIAFQWKGDELSTDNPRDCERHWCHACVEAVRRFMNGPLSKPRTAR